MPRGFGGPPWHPGKRGGWFMQPPVWGFLQPCLLLLLAEGPRHGYSLMEVLAVRGLLGGEVDVGNLYRTLRRMEAEGLVESTWSGPGARPHRRVYRVTSPGVEVLRAWTGTLEERTALMNRFLDEFHRVFGPSSGAPETKPDRDKFV